MDRLRIQGGRQLRGEIRISGSKNASLPLMVAALLTDRKLTLHNVPRLADIGTMIQLLAQHGVEIDAAPGENGHERGTTLTLQAKKITSTTAPYDIVRKMRASVLVLGPLLAREPEITDLAECLVAMGVPVKGIGTETLTIDGVKSLNEATHSVIADRIETGTYAMAVAMTAGDVELIGGRLDLIEAAAQSLRQAGVTLEKTERGLRVHRTNGALTGVDVMTEPYPGFPTDLQAQMMALMTRAEGASMITETVFESRFMHVPELSRMGANVTIHHESALVRGVPKLRGAEVMATDLRASVSLAIAALAAEGSSVVNRLYHLDRGYERLEEKLGACGADIERLRS